MTRRSLCSTALAAFVWLLASAALADATVHLNNGGMIRGELMESLPGEHVSEQELERQRTRLTLGLAPRPQGAELRLRLAF